MTAPLMRCYEARPYLSAYVDGEVDAGLAERIYEHLAACADCRKTVAKYRAIDALIGQLPAPGPSPEVLDRVLAATSSLNKERAVRESLRRPEKPLAPRSLPAFILADTNLAAPVRMRQAVSQSRLSWVLARALPAMAALLIITLTLVSFHGLRGQTPTVVHPAPDRSPASEVALTYQQVFENSAGKLSGLGFVPLLPSILPEGATFHSVSVLATDTGQKSLDVVWSLGTPFKDMHLREMGVPLVARTDYVVQSPNALQTWQIPGAPQWQTMVDSGNTTGRLVVGEDRVQFSITLDIGLRGGGYLFPINPEARPALTYLRLTSLSIDSHYQPLGTLSVPNDAMVVHFRMQTVGERDGRPYQWDVYWNESTGESRAALYDTTGSGMLGTLIYTDYLSGGAVARCPPRGLCERIPLSSPQVANDPFELSTKVQTFLTGINGFIRDAELWNLGGPQTGLAGYGIGTTALYALAYVSGPYPITVYVYAATLQVAAVISQINLAGSITPGSKNGQPPLTSLGGCAVSYPLLVFLDPHSLNLYPDLQAADVGNQPSMPTVATCSQ
jgi:Putative zinc-finger